VPDRIREPETALLGPGELSADRAITGSGEQISLSHA